MKNFHFLHLTKKFLPCEQWFLAVGRYGAKGKKTLRATLRFAIKDARPRDAYVKTSNGVTSSQRTSEISDTSTKHFTWYCVYYLQPAFYFKSFQNPKLSKYAFTYREMTKKTK